MAGKGRLDLVQLDLASLASVRACDDALHAVVGQSDLVIANAGVMATPYGHAADGFETQNAENRVPDAHSQTPRIAMTSPRRTIPTRIL